MSFKEDLNERVAEIEKIITFYLPREEGYQKTVMEAMNYSVLAGGKRLRPMLMQETYRFFGGISDIVEPFMAAIEMIHTYSLVHDDLPAMDNDEYRRGQKTTHVRYGHAMGILAGDALLHYAFETMAKAADAVSQTKTEEYYLLLERCMAAQRILAEKSGIYGMVGGQTVDVEATEKGERLSLEKLDFIYRLKTSALIEGAMMAGAVLASAAQEELASIEEIAGKIGLAFQIQDDILDVTGTMEMLGKPVLSDEKNKKVTYVTLIGLEESGRIVEATTKEALTMLEELAKNRKCDGEFLKKLLTWLIHREK